MSEISVTHGAFTIERAYDAAVARVYAAFADEKAKAKWFMGPPGEWTQKARTFDFRVGGRERLLGLWKGGFTTDFNCHYHDIVPNERIIYSYDMLVNEKRISVSLASLQFKPAGKGTLLNLNEQGVYLDGAGVGAGDANAAREHGTRALLDALAHSLQSAAA